MVNVETFEEAAQEILALVRNERTSTAAISRAANKTQEMIQNPEQVPEELWNLLGELGRVLSPEHAFEERQDITRMLARKVEHLRAAAGRTAKPVALNRALGFCLTFVFELKHADNQFNRDPFAPA